MSVSMPPGLAGVVVPEPSDRVQLARSPSPIPAPGPRAQRGTTFWRPETAHVQVPNPGSQTQLPELVRDARLDTRVEGNTTIHRRIVRRRGAPQEERWIRYDDNILGHGGGGLVWLEHKLPQSGTDSSERRAVKAIRIPGGGATMKGLHYVRELEALAKFSQERYAEFFVRFAGWYEIPKYLCISMEYCEHGDLKRYLESAKTLPEYEARDIASQVLCALAMMHQEGFAHRDVKPANILIKSKPPEGWWVKVCDLGLTKRAVDITGATTVRGTPGFWAPETLGFNGHAPLTDARPTDMWCFGETIFQMLTGHSTFDSVAALYQYQAGVIAFPREALSRAHASHASQHFIHSLMAADPSHRPTAQTAQGHHWIWSYSQPIDDPAVAQSKGHTTSAWPPDVPARSPEQFTQASGRWTETVVMRDHVRGATLFPTPNDKLVQRGNFPGPGGTVSGQEDARLNNLAYHFPPLGGADFDTKLRSQKPGAPPLYTAVSDPQAPQKTYGFLVRDRSSAAHGKTPLIAEEASRITGSSPPLSDNKTTADRVKSNSPTIDADISSPGEGKARPPSPGASPQSSDRPVGRLGPTREKDNVAVGDQAPATEPVAEDTRDSAKGDISVLGSFKSFASTLRADVESKRRRLEKRNRDLKMQELKEFAKTLELRTPLTIDQLAAGADQEEDKAAKKADLTDAERSLAKKRVEVLRDFSKTFELRTPIPEDLVSILANDPAKQQEMIARQNLITARQQEAASAEKGLQAGPGRSSEAQPGDRKSPPAETSSTESISASALQARDPAIVEIRPAPPVPLITTKSWAAVVAQGKGEPQGTSVGGNDHQLESALSKKAKRRKKRQSSAVHK
ncbi:kinase-like protein [Coniochaeta sp. PMI_546]|nr:kinase-like protein [Coniochaeta sp. PMI_546]